MKARFLCIIQLALSLVMLMVMVVGCAQSPQTSKYPADLSGRVTISEKMKYPNAPSAVSPGGGYVFWIVEISVKNVTYSNPITDYRYWRIVANDSILQSR